MENICNLGFASKRDTFFFFYIVKFLFSLPKEELTNHHSSLQTIRECNKYKSMIASYAHLLN